MLFSALLAPERLADGRCLLCLTPKETKKRKKTTVSVRLSNAHVCMFSNGQIPELSNPSVCMRDPERVQEVLQSMVKAGSNTVQVHDRLRCLRVHYLPCGDTELNMNRLVCFTLLSVVHPGDLGF